MSLVPATSSLWTSTIVHEQSPLADINNPLVHFVNSIWTLVGYWMVWVHKLTIHHEYFGHFVHHSCIESVDYVGEWEERSSSINKWHGRKIDVWNGNSVCVVDAFHVRQTKGRTIKKLQMSFVLFSKMYSMYEKLYEVSVTCLHLVS